MAKRLVSLLVATLAVLALAAPAGASGRLKVGFFDEALVFSNPDNAFALFTDLRAQVVRVNLYWKDVAPVRPVGDATNPLTPGYNWTAYDIAAQKAQAMGAELLLHVIGTPGWANGGRDWRFPPSNMADLRDFTVAAARRYSGLPLWGGMPAVSKWAAWNEPNLSTFLRPSWGRVGGRLVPVAAQNYAKICNTVWSAVHAAAAEGARAVQVACGVTSPYGKGGKAVPPLRFLREMKRSKARFDVYAHHPYSRSKGISPSAIPPQRRNTVSLGNIGDLVRELNRLYGKSKRIWVTEYGYQTNPPDPAGVSLARQAEWMKKAHTIMRRHPRIDMMIWFLVKDEPDTNGAGFGYDGWQSGLMDFAGTRKPAYATFQALPRF